MPSTAQQGSGPLIESCLCELRQHDHLCLIYESREEQLAALVPFVRVGIERGERCFYVADGRTVADVEPAMRAGGVDVESELARGALAVATERETYLAAGEFDPDAMLAMAEGAAAQAVGAGYGGLRIAGEMTWALGDDAKIERLMEYEVKVNRRIPHVPVLAVCQYDRRRFSPEVIRDVIRTHPLIAVGGRVCRNFYYVPPDELIGPDRLHREVDRLLENIYEREQAESALRESERRLARVLEGSNDAFWDCDLTKGEIAFSPRWGEITGRGPASGIEAWKRSIHPDDLAPTWAAVMDHLEGRSELFVGEYRVRGCEGGWRWIQARGKVVTWGPGRRPERMAGTATDVTERRTLQVRLEMAGRLASVGTLVAGIAHEINNPLAYVTGNLRYLSEQLAAGSRGPSGPGGLEQAVAESLDGAERVREVVQGLRRFAGPAGEGRREPVDVGAEVEAAAGIARHQVASRARLTVDVAPGLPQVVAGLHEIGQVVVNLLVNAAQAIPEGHAAENEVKVTARAAEGRVLRRGLGHRARHPARRAAAHLRPVLHDEAGRHGQRARPRHLPRDRGRGGREHPRPVRARPWHGVRRGAPRGPGGGGPGRGARAEGRGGRQTACPRRGRRRPRGARRRAAARRGARRRGVDVRGRGRAARGGRRALGRRALRPRHARHVAARHRPRGRAARDVEAGAAARACSSSAIPPTAHSAPPQPMSWFPSTRNTGSGPPSPAAQPPERRLVHEEARVVRRRRPRRDRGAVLGEPAGLRAGAGRIRAALVDVVSELEGEVERLPLRRPAHGARREPLRDRPVAEVAEDEHAHLDRPGGGGRRDGLDAVDGVVEARREERRRERGGAASGHALRRGRLREGRERGGGLAGPEALHARDHGAGGLARRRGGRPATP